MLLRFALIATLAVLAGCQRAEADGKAEARDARVKRAHELAAQPPQRTVYHLEGGDLVVLDIATVAPGGFADSQKCFVWRDAEFKTSSLACPPDTPADIPDTH